MPAAILPLLVKPVLGAAGLALLTAFFSESPADAAQRVRLGAAFARVDLSKGIGNAVEIALRQQQIAQNNGGGMMVIDLSQVGGSVSSVVGGSEDASAIVGAGATPAEAIAQLDRLDEQWGPAVDAYRQLHSIPHPLSWQQQQGMWGRRYPTRWAVLRLTIDALTHSDALAAKYGEQWGISDPSTGKLKNSWLSVVATYAPSDQEWAEVNRQVEEHYARAAESSDWLDSLKEGLALASAAVDGKWGAVARAVFGSGGNTGARVGARVMAREEAAIYQYCKTRFKAVMVSRFKVSQRDYSRPSVWQVRLSLAEALSGGGTPLQRALNSFGGVAKLAADIRAGAGDALTIQTKSVTDETLVLKAVAICRRKPTPGNESAGVLQEVLLSEYNPAALERGPT